MELNFSKKTRKIVASLLAVAILLGVLPVSGLTGNSSGAEGNNGSANTIFVKSDYQPVLFDSNGKVKSVLTKKTEQKMFILQHLKTVTKLVFLKIKTLEQVGQSFSLRVMNGMLHVCTFGKVKLITVALLILR